MKKVIFSWLVFTLLFSTGYAQYSTDRTGYEGDYFSLEGALDLFKESSSLRDFERKINTEQNWVNNLDLNYDGRTDYIRVEHRRQGNFHVIILQALVDRYDVQDVAVIEIEIIRRGEAVLQIIGDEDLYGEEVYVEPVEGYSDSRRRYDSDYDDYVNVYYWRPVQYILGRQYRVYVSPYRWHYYPTWWNPWVQVSWSIFRPRIVVYVNRYHVVHRHRLIRVHNFYRPYRSYCNTVVQRANRVRVSHGRSPIHRPDPVRQRDGRPGNYGDRNNIRDRSQTITRSNPPRQDAPLSRNRSLSSPDQDVSRSRNQRTDQRTRSSVNKPDTQRSITRPNSPRQEPSISRKSTVPSGSRDVDRSRNQRSDQRTRSSVNRPDNQRSITRSSTPRQNPSVSRNNSPAYGQDGNRSRAPRMNQQSQRTPSRSGSATRKPSTESRNMPSASPKPNRSVPSRSYERSGNNTSRSGTTTRSSTPSRKPSASSNRRSVPASKPKAVERSSSKKNTSRSRRGGGEPEK